MKKKIYLLTVFLLTFGISVFIQSLFVKDFEEFDSKIDFHWTKSSFYLGKGWDVKAVERDGVKTYIDAFSMGRESEIRFSLPQKDTYTAKLYLRFEKEGQPVGIYVNDNFIREYISGAKNSNVEDFYFRIPQDVVKVGRNVIKIVNTEPVFPLMIEQIKLKNYRSQLSENSYLLSKPMKMSVAAVEFVISITAALLGTLMFALCGSFLGNSEMLLKRILHLLLGFFILGIVLYSILNNGGYSLVIVSNIYSPHSMFRIVLGMLLLCVIAAPGQFFMKLYGSFGGVYLKSAFAKKSKKQLFLDYSITAGRTGRRLLLFLIKCFIYFLISLDKFFKWAGPFLKKTFIYSRLIIGRISNNKGFISVLVGINIIIYFRLLWAYFGMEDPMVIADAIIASTSKHFSFLFQPIHNEFTRYFRSFLNYAFYQIAGISAWPHYLYALILQILNSILLYCLVLRLTRYKWMAFITALFFVCLRNTTEVMTWYGASSMYLPAVFFLLSAFLLFLKYKENQRKYILVPVSALLYLLALTANQSGIVFLGIIFLYDVFFDFQRFNVFQKKKILSNLGYFLKTYTPYVIVAYVFLKFIQKSITVVTPGNFDRLVDFIMSYVKAVPHLIFPIPMMMFLSDFFRLHGMGWLAKEGYLYPIVTFTILFFISAMAVILQVRRAKNSTVVDGRLIIFSVFCAFIAYLPFALTVLTGYTNRSDELAYIHLRYYYLASIFGSIIFGIILVSLYETVKRQKIKTIIVILGCLVIFYNGFFKIPMVWSMVKWTSEAKQMIQDIKSYYPEFPDKSIICIVGADAEDHPATNSRHVKELLFLFYADPRNPVHLKDLEEYEMDVQNISNSFNRNRQLYLNYTNIADVYIAKKPHIWGWRIFDHPYLNENVGAYERVLMGLRYKWFEPEQVYVFKYEYKPPHRPTLVDITQETRPKLHDFVKTLERFKPLVEEFDEKGDKLKWVSVSPCDIEDDVLKLKILSKSFDKRSDGFDGTLAVRPVLLSEEVNISAAAECLIQVRMKAGVPAFNSMNFPVANLKLSHLDVADEFGELKKKLEYLEDIKNITAVETLADLEKYLFSFNVEVSSVYGKDGAGYSADYLMDGGFGESSAWKAGCEQSWIEVDFKAPVAINEFIWSSDRTRKTKGGVANRYVLEVSLDRENWQAVKKADFVEMPEAGFIEDKFETVKAQFIRMRILETNDGKPAVIDEVKVLTEKIDLATRIKDLLEGNSGYLNKLKVIDDRNKFLNFKAYASTLYGGHPYLRTENLVDGKYGEKHAWMGAPDSGFKESWVKIDLKEPFEINRIQWSCDRRGLQLNTIKNYTLYASLDDKNWTEIKKVENVKRIFGRVNVDEFPPVKARYVKMLITKTEGSQAYYAPPLMDEFEVFGPDFNYGDFQDLLGQYERRFDYINTIPEAEAAINTGMKAKLWWVTSEDKSWITAGSESFDLILDDEFHDYKFAVDLTKSRGWQGILDNDVIFKQFLLELGPFAANYEIDYIKIIPKEKPYERPKDYYVDAKTGEEIHEIYALGTYKERLFAAGRYPVTVGVVYEYVDGNWQVTYNRGTESQIFCLGEYKGLLLAGTNPEKDPGAKILTYDGREWKRFYEFGPQEALQVFDVFEYKDKLYASTGHFGKIFVYDGREWKVSFNGQPLGFHSILTLCEHEGRLYAGSGARDHKAKVVVYDEKEDKWDIILNSPDNTTVYCLASYGGKLYAGTLVGAPGGKWIGGKVLEYDGEQWRESFDTEQHLVFSLCVYNDKLYAATGGDGMVFVFDGEKWELAFNPRGWTMRGMTVYKDMLAVGSEPIGRVFLLNDIRYKNRWTETFLRAMDK